MTATGAAGRCIRTMAVAAVLALGALSGPALATDVSAGSCGWPMRIDPTLVNALLPDDNAVYYITAIPTPPLGTHYRIVGSFPHARYISYAAYNGFPIDAIADVDIRPDPGSANPFLPLADRTVTRRGYVLDVLDEPKPADAGGRAPNVLYTGAGQLGTPTPVPYLVYRIYLPDRGTDVRGGVGLPSIHLVDDQSGADSGPVDPACETARDFVPGGPLGDVQWQYANASPPPSASGGRGATNPPTWEAEPGPGEALGALGQGTPRGGPGGNPHTIYVKAKVSRVNGPVLAIRAKAPVTPRTLAGEPVMAPLTLDGRPSSATPDLRYFSFCQSSPTTRSIACLSDEDTVIDPDGTFTIAVSTPADRPATARNWIAFGPEPSGLLLYRHMLPSPAFYPHSGQYVAATGAPIEQAMGDYYPRSTYCTASEFDADRCGL